MNLTFFGHACFEVTVNGKRLLFDPFITPNSLASDIKLADIKADYILVSHGHVDHIADLVELQKLTGATVISNFEIVSWAAKQGVTKTHPLNHGGGYRFEFGRVKYVNAIHSSVLPDGTYGGNPGGFVVETSEGSFYYSGDTALTYDMKLIGEDVRLDFAVLPIGDNFTMGPRDAVRAADFVGATRVVGVHYDTFPPICIDHAAARETFSAGGKVLLLPKIGETIRL
jgi:L-ascorbate metabolism protein UlaG (beta-lactamase superfamily)